MTGSGPGDEPPVVVPAEITYDPDALLKEFGRLTMENRQMQERLRANSQRLAAIKDRCTEEFDRRGMRQVNFVGIGTLYLNPSGWAKLKGGTDEKGKYTQEQRDAGAAALRRAGLGELVKPGFSLQSVSARYREWHKQHEHPPPELDEAFEFDRDYDIGVRSTPEPTERNEQ